MKTVTGLVLIAIGAILALAVSAQPSFLNLHVVGWILILTGAVGLVVPRGTRIWRRERARWGVGPAAAEVEVDVEEADEQKYSSLLVPGGIDPEYTEDLLTHESNGPLEDR
jgi:hypothetical protein